MSALDAINLSLAIAIILGVAGGLAIVTIICDTCAARAERRLRSWRSR